MRKTLIFVGSIILTLAAMPGTAQERMTTEKLVRLETHLEKIRREYEFNRVMGGGTLVATGALIGVGGTLVAQSSSFVLYDGSISDAQAYQEQMRTTLTAVSWLYGGAFLVPGFFTLVLKTDYETLPERFRKEPGSTDREAADKIIRGEVMLQSLSDKARADRWLSAGLMGLSGLSMVYLAYQEARPYASSSWGNAGTDAVFQSPGFVSGALVLGAALLRAVIPTTPENENRAYLAWKD